VNVAQVNVNTDLCLCHSDLMGALSQTLNHTEQSLAQMDHQDSATKTKLDSVTSDAQKLERTVKELLDQVEFIKNSDIRGKNNGSQHSGGVWWKGLLK